MKLIALPLSLPPSINQTPDKFGITPLLAAVYEGHKDVVKVLLEKVSKIFAEFHA